jgi:hypothetical protein
MALAQDLMALGLGPQLATEIAEGGVGPLTVTVTGNSAATAAKVYGDQSCITVTAGTGALILPSPTGTNPPNMADQFVIHNGLGPVATVYAPAGVTINIGGAAYAGANPFSLTTLKTLIIWTAPTTTQWFGMTS